MYQVASLCFYFLKNNHRLWPTQAASDASTITQPHFVCADRFTTTLKSLHPFIPYPLHQTTSKQIHSVVWERNTVLIKSTIRLDLGNGGGRRKETVCPKSLEQILDRPE
jgi:hypothetical protein